MTITAVGGAGGVDHYFSDGTVVEELTGTPFTGSAHGYRVVMRASGTMRSPVVFLDGRLTAEPIDSSAEHLTFSINGSAPKPLQQVSDEALTYTCSGNVMTESDTTGDVIHIPPRLLNAVSRGRDQSGPQATPSLTVAGGSPARR